MLPQGSTPHGAVFFLVAGAKCSAGQRDKLRCRRRTTALAEGFSTAGDRSHHSRRGGRTAPLPRLSRPVGSLLPGLTRVSLASFVMASSFPCCEIRQLLVHIYPGGSKAGAAERITVFYGRRGRPVKKPRFIPAERAHFWARKLQARRLGTVAVL